MHASEQRVRPGYFAARCVPVCSSSSTGPNPKPNPNKLTLAAAAVCCHRRRCRGSAARGSRTASGPSPPLGLRADTVRMCTTSLGVLMAKWGSLHSPLEYSPAPLLSRYRYLIIEHLKAWKPFLIILNIILCTSYSKLHYIVFYVYLYK